MQVSGIALLVLMKSFHLCAPHRCLLLLLCVPYLATAYYCPGSYVYDAVLSVPWSNCDGTQGSCRGSCCSPSGAACIPCLCSDNSQGLYATCKAIDSASDDQSFCKNIRKAYAATKDLMPYCVKERIKRLYTENNCGKRPPFPWILLTHCSGISIMSP